MMHLRRWLTSIVAVPILIYILGPGPRWLFQSLVSIACVVSMYEFLAITSPTLPKASRIWTFVLSLAIMIFTAQGPFSMVLGLLPLWVILLWCIHLFCYSSERAHSIDHLGKISLGLLYIALPLALLLVIDKQPGGSRWIFFLLTVVFCGDAGAFYAGRYLGRHKLYPSISPGKTLEGSAGGFLVSLLAALPCAMIFPLHKPVTTLLGLGACLSVAAQIGDLAESLLKRVYGLKDSGRILPGHGGILDRIDGVLFSIPVLYLFLL